MLQVQTELGPGHINLINVYELILSDDYLGLVMEYAQGGSLTAHVAERWGTATAGKLVMDEDEARYFFRVRSHPYFAHSLECWPQAHEWASLCSLAAPSY